MNQAFRHLVRAAYRAGAPFGIIDSFGTDQRAYVADLLRGILTPNQTVFTILRHVSASGMSRRISLMTFDGTDGMRNIDDLCADLIDNRVHAHGGIITTGCGTDMGFHLVYTIGAHLWPNGTLEPHGHRNGEPDNSGGYALKQKWL